MSDTTFVSTFSSLTTLSLISSDLEVERFEITNGIKGTINHIERQLERGTFSAGFKIAIFEFKGEEVAVLYIEDWRPQCFPEDVLDEGESAMSNHRDKIHSERLGQLKDKSRYNDSWTAIVDEHDVADGGGEFGQTQFFAVDKSAY